MNEKGTKKINRIAVVGGGIGGLTFAIAMRHHGIDVDIYPESVTRTAQSLDWHGFRAFFRSPAG